MLLPSLVVVVVFIGIPAAVSFVESWSWLWLWYYSPTITGCLWLLATAAATLVVVRSRNLLVRQ